MARHLKRAAELGLDAIQIEGGLIAPDQVAKIAATDRTAKAAADYDCPKGTNLGDEIARYFRIGQAIWQSYARIDRPTVTQTAQFAHDLLDQAFGFTDLAGPRDHRDGTRRYRIAWEAKDGRVPIVVAAPAIDERGRDIGFTRALPEFGDGEGGRPRRNPVVLLQDWLNANPDFYWGLVFAGDRVRLMRDNASLTRPAWIEADLGAIFRDEMFADFTAWWLTTHATRFGAAGAPPSDAALERWREAGLKQGTAARDRLREGVETALTELGQGLIEANPDIRARIEANALAMPALFEELLRTVYRLIFLAVAEERDLLHPRGTGQKTRDLYAQSYGFIFWRERSARRVARDAHHDAWEGMKVTLAALEHGQPLLGLPALGGLFARAQTPVMAAARIPNRRFLAAVYSLGYVLEQSAPTRINWRDMKTEELGSVYESLLEIQPFLATDGRFALDSGAKGNARKTSGSYYTPDSLVETLLDSALDPVLARAEAEGGADAILDLKVIDPACGSGHFLLGAARRMADRVASLRDPDAPDTQTALRDVVGRCIHGVDRNPMAVELARVALWIESVSPGQPLGFLDANIRCGDALLGVFDLAVLEEGVPDEAYKPLTGDDKAAARYYAQQNKAARKGQGQFDWSGGGGAMPPLRLASSLTTVRRMPEETVGQVERKRAAFAEWEASPAAYATRVACDLYVAAFLMPKTEVPLSAGRNIVPTTADVRTRLAGGQICGPLEAEGIEAAGKASAFHWPLAFPDVMVERGGFDVVLGNPPWERIKLQEQEFFAGTPVAEAPNAAARTRAIEALGLADPGSPDRLLYQSFQVARRTAEAMSLFARVPGDGGGRYRYTGTGDVNTYALFAEHFLNLTRESGRSGIIVPTGIAMDATTAPFFNFLLTNQRLAELRDFQTGFGYFNAIGHATFKFCLLTITGSAFDEAPTFSFVLKTAEDIADPVRVFKLSTLEIQRLNPNTGTLPIFRTRHDAKITAGIYDRVPVLIEDAQGASGNPWDISFMAMFHMSNDSGQFRTAAQLEGAGWVRDRSGWVQPASSSASTAKHERYVPLYEAKMIHQFDYRWATYAAGTSGDDDSCHVTLAEKQDPLFEPTPRYWVPDSEVRQRLAAKGWASNWLMGWRDVTKPQNERTTIASALPATSCNDKLLLMLPRRGAQHCSALLGNLDTLTLDFVSRQKVGGTALKYFIFKQLPILPPTAYSEADLGFIVPRVLELTYTSHSMAPFAHDLGHDGPPFAWDEARRADLRAELDAWYALAYGLSRDELRYVLDPKDVMGADYPSETFRVLQKNELAKLGEYRTQRLVLAAYDKLAAASPDTSSTSDNQWQRTVTSEADVQMLLIALLKRMRQPRSLGEIRWAFLYSAQPHLLTPQLSAERQAEWRRLVGQDALLPTTQGVVSFASNALRHFGSAREELAGRRVWRYDPASRTVDRGAAVYDIALRPWAEGRADFVWHALRSIDLIAAISTLSQEEQLFVGQAAAA